MKTLQLPARGTLTKDDVENELGWGPDRNRFAETIARTFLWVDEFEDGQFQFEFSVEAESRLGIGFLEHLLKSLVTCVERIYDVDLRPDPEDNFRIEVSGGMWFVMHRYDQWINPDDLPPLDFSKCGVPVVYNPED